MLHKIFSDFSGPGVCVTLISKKGKFKCRSLNSAQNYEVRKIMGWCMGVWAYGIWVGIWDWDGLMGFGWDWVSGDGIWAASITVHHSIHSCIFTYETVLVKTYCIAYA